MPGPGRGRGDCGCISPRRRAWAAAQSPKPRLHGCRSSSQEPGKGRVISGAFAEPGAGGFEVAVVGITLVAVL